ncbi:hypothetical protein ASC59_06005 [Leifsonia sp. Root1293]|nr:hypothetical protein ASC59_06005 [Leifsonia sp. Root1293]KRA11612.1 hypothetical protein ASD61_06005 [Leifsonia sp. Root60]
MVGVLAGSAEGAEVSDELAAHLGSVADFGAASDEADLGVLVVHPIEEYPAARFRFAGLKDGMPGGTHCCSVALGWTHRPLQGTL